MDRCGIAAVFAANAQLDTRTRRPAPFHREPHQFADAVHIDGNEGVNLENSPAGIFLK